MAAPRKITEKAWREFWGRSRSPQLTPEQIKSLQKQGVFLRYQPVAEGQLGLKSIEAQVESASVGVSPTKAEQKELDALRNRSGATKNPSYCGAGAQRMKRRRYNKLLERHDRLLKHLEQTQWQGTLTSQQRLLTWLNLFGRQNSFARSVLVRCCASSIV